MSRYYRDGAATPDFARLLAALATTLGVKLADERTRAYAKLLGDLDWPTLLRACEAAANRKWFGGFPQPGDLRECVAATETDRALLAWMALERAAEQAGAWADVEAEDGAAVFAVDMAFGGWPQFCEADDGPARTQARTAFLAAYRQAVRAGLTRPARLHGRCDAPPDRLAATWVAQLDADGQLRMTRDGTANRVIGGARGVLEQGTDAQAAEGAPEAAGGGAGPGGPPARRRP